MQGTDHIASATLLSVGPIGAPSTGQAIATENWIKNSTHKIEALNNNFEGLDWRLRLWRTILLPFSVLLSCRRLRPTALYLSMKRSVFGALADLTCVIMFRCVVSGPVVVHLHGADLIKLRESRLANALVQLLWRAVTDIIVLSPRMVEQLDGLPDRRVHVVPNFSAQFSAEHTVLAKAKDISGGPLRVLYLSNIMFTKGFTYLVDAVKALRLEGLDVRLTLAGKALDDENTSGSDAITALRSRIVEGIEYIGVIDGDRKWEQLARAHVIALPTFYPIEAQPIALIEGMAFGAIPLTTRHNYNEDFLDSDITLFVEKRSSLDISEALRSLLSDRSAAACKVYSSWKLANERHQLSAYVTKIDRVLADAICDYD